MTSSHGGMSRKLTFLGKENRKYLRGVKVIPGELQHSLVVVDLVNKKVKKVVRKEAFERRKVWKLMEDDTRANFEERVGKLVSADALDLWKCFREGMLKAFDEVCGKTKGRRDQEDTLWWNKDVGEAITRKKESNEGGGCAGAKRELSENPNQVFKLVKSIKKDGKDVEEGRCIRGSNGRLNFSEKDRGRVWKGHMERIMNEENEWDQNVQADLVEGPVERVRREEVVKALGKMKAGKAAGPYEVSVEMIAASEEIGIDVMVELCQNVLDARGMLDEWALSVVVPIFKGKGDAMNCGAYRGVKLLEHAKKILKKALERRMRHMGKVDEMQFCFMPSKGTIDAVSILRRLQEEYLEKEKNLY